MKFIKLIPTLILLSVATYGQSIHKSPVRETARSKAYPMDGTPFLQKQYEQAAEYVRTHPDFAKSGRLAKTAIVSDTVGTRKSLWVYNGVTTEYYQTASTCRKVGTHCYIYVEDSLWTDGRATQAAVDSIENDFDNKTPANPNEGIYDMDTGAFGNPPNVDGDPRIIVFICNILDGYNGSGGYIAGFFDPNQEVGYNNAEIYYVDADPTDLTTADGIEIAMSTAAHEFQHMINWNYHQNNDEPTFINEGCSMLAELYCGYPPTDLSLYANETNMYLFNWRFNDNTLVLNDYARTQRFHLYLWDRYGIGLFKDIVSNTNADPIAILSGALSAYGASQDFYQVFANWLVANELNDTTSNRLYGYAYANLPVSNGRTYFNPNVSATDTIQPIACRYLIFKGGSNLSITFTNPSGSSNLSVTAMEMGSGASIVVNVPFGTQFTESNFGTIYTTIAFAVVNKDPNNPIVYSYQASGTASTTTTEVKWDNTEPVGYFQWATSDTMCVAFDAYPGGTLDSIRVALRRAGSIIGGVYEYTGVPEPSPLGNLLARDTARITTTTSVPYPVPYQNWTTINLSSYNISTEQPFAVAFVSGDNPTVPGVMITEYPGQNPYHSFTYINADEAGGTPGWYYISTSADSIAIYLIRAYVRFTTGVTKQVAPMPIRFSLGQNYPNPFNPTTVISYHLPTSTVAVLKIFDVLGREVATLVNQRQSAGSHSVDFNAANLPSGVYFYRLSAGTYQDTKKLLLLK